MRNEIPIIAKRAEAADIQNVFELSNDEDVRMASYNSRRIRYCEHEKWFLGKIGDPHTLFLLFYSELALVVQIRFSNHEDNSIVSVSVAKAARGTGAAYRAMKLAIKILREENPNIKKITAYVKNDNIRSKKYFANCGFNYKGKKNIRGYNTVIQVCRLEE